MSKHDKTLAAIFARPTRANLKWRDIESLLKSIGAMIEEGEGSRIHIFLNGRTLTVHRPHPRPEASKAVVDGIREFLLLAGINP